MFFKNLSKVQKESELGGGPARVCLHPPPQHNETVFFRSLGMSLIRNGKVTGKNLGCTMEYMDFSKILEFRKIVMRRYWLKIQKNS